MQQQASAAPAEKRPAIEQRSIDYIPVAERHGKAWHLWPVWFTGNVQLTTAATGAVGALLGGNLIWMVIAVLLGCLLGTFFMAMISTQGPQLGLPQMVQSRPQFGYVGALLVWIVALITYVGYNSINQLLAVQTIQSVFGGGDKTLVLLLFSVASVAVAVVGYDLIHLVQRWIAVAMILVLLIFSVAMLRLHLPAAQFALPDFRLLPFVAQLFASAAYMLSWCIYVSDYSRYLPKDVNVRSSFWWTYIGCFSGGAWMMLVGTLAAALYPKLDQATGVRVLTDSAIPGFGGPLLLVSLLALVTITSLNFYGAALALLCVADSIRPLALTATKRIVAMLFCAVVATSVALLASQNFMAGYSGFLDVLLYLFTPWIAINLVDFYIVRKGQYSVREIFNPKGLYGRWNWRGLLSYGVGFAAMVPFFRDGPIKTALGGINIAMIVGLPVAALCYWLACRSLDVEAERKRVHAADIGLDPDIAA